MVHNKDLRWFAVSLLTSAFYIEGFFPVCAKSEVEPNVRPLSGPTKLQQSAATLGAGRPQFTKVNIGDMAYWAIHTIVGDWD
jgi:hypothetical protein